MTAEGTVGGPICSYKGEKPTKLTKIKNNLIGQDEIVKNHVR